MGSSIDPLTLLGPFGTVALVPLGAGGVLFFLKLMAVPRYQRCFEGRGFRLRLSLIALRVGVIDGAAVVLLLLVGAGVGFQYRAPHGPYVAAFLLTLVIHQITLAPLRIGGEERPPIFHELALSFFYARVESLWRDTLRRQARSLSAEPWSPEALDKLADTAIGFFTMRDEGERINPHFTESVRQWLRKGNRELLFYTILEELGTGFIDRPFPPVDSEATAGAETAVTAEGARVSPGEGLGRRQDRVPA
jgi:hypothetical protein